MKWNHPYLDKSQSRYHLSSCRDLRVLLLHSPITVQTSIRCSRGNDPPIQRRQSEPKSQPTEFILSEALSVRPHLFLLFNFIVQKCNRIHRRAFITEPRYFVCKLFSLISTGCKSSFAIKVWSLYVPQEVLFILLWKVFSVPVSLGPQSWLKVP